MAQHGDGERGIIGLMRADQGGQGEVELPLHPIMELAFVNGRIPFSAARKMLRTYCLQHDRR